jgi:hypothetical protein
MPFPGMMSRPPMDGPPPPPTEVQSQMGVPQPPAPEAAGLSGIVNKGGPPGGANPHGFVMAQAAAIKDVLGEMAKNEPGFAPFSQRIIQLLDTAVAAISAAPKPGGFGAEPPGGGMPPAPGGAGQLPPMA